MSPRDGEPEVCLRGDITLLLQRMEDGQVEAREDLLSLVYAPLGALARRHLARERAGHTLETRALVHEAYLRLVDQTRPGWRSRGHFFAVASLIMRRVLVNHARARRRLKRGNGAQPSPLEGEACVATGCDPEQLLVIDDLLARLSEIDPGAARVVECRFFGGLTVEETAEAVGTSTTSVKRAWRAGRAWLRRELGP